jgi:hypothetical protein
VLEISSKKGENPGKCRKFIKKCRSIFNFRNLFQIQMGKKTTFFAATQNHHHQTVRCISVEEKIFFTTQNYLKNSLPHRIYKLNKKIKLV